MKSASRLYTKQLKFKLKGFRYGYKDENIQDVNYNQKTTKSIRAEIYGYWIATFTMRITVLKLNQIWFLINYSTDNMMPKLKGTACVGNILSTKRSAYGSRKHTVI